MLLLASHSLEAATKMFAELSREEAESKGINPQLGALVPGHE